MNKASDLYGLLRILWDDTIETSFTRQATDIAIYDDVKNRLVGRVLSRQDLEEYRWILDPYAFKGIVKPPQPGSVVFGLIAFCLSVTSGNVA